MEYQKAGICFMFTDLLQNLIKQNSKRKWKRIWVQNWLLKIEEESVFLNILEELLIQDAKNYRTYVRMNTYNWDKWLFHKGPESCYSTVAKPEKHQLFAF